MPPFEYTNLNLTTGSVLVRKFHGTINVDLIIESWEYLLGSGLLTDKHIGVINDLSDSTLEMDAHCFMQLISYLKSKPAFSKIKLAVLCDSPKKTIFPTMGQFAVKELQIRPFTTYEASLDWIGML